MAHAERAAHGVEPICRVLPIAPSAARQSKRSIKRGTFYDHFAKRADPSRLLDRAVRDAELKTEIEPVFEEKFSVYGFRKVWRQMRRDGFHVARFAVARSPLVHCFAKYTAGRWMKDIGIEGVIRGKKPRTTIPPFGTLFCNRLPGNGQSVALSAGVGEPSVPCPSCYWRIT